MGGLINEAKAVLRRRLAEFGFVASGPHFRRTSERGDLAVITLQVSAGSFESHESFHVNFGAAPAAWIAWRQYQKDMIKRVPYDPARPPKPLAAYECLLDGRLHPSRGSDSMGSAWELRRAGNPARVLTVLWNDLVGETIPLLDRWQERDGYASARQGVFGPHALPDVVELMLIIDDAKQRDRSAEIIRAVARRESFGEPSVMMMPAWARQYLELLAT